MAKATYVHSDEGFDYTPGDAVTAGDVILVTPLLGIAKRDIAANAKGWLSLSGTFDIVKGAETITAGDAVYWDVADQKATADADSGTNKALGRCVLDAAEADATVRVRRMVV